MIGGRTNRQSPVLSSIAAISLTALTIEDVPWGAPGIRFLDSPGQRAFGTNRRSSGSRDHGVPEQAGREDEFVVRTERIASRRRLIQHEFGDEGSAAELLLFLRDGLPMDLNFLYVDAKHFHDRSPS